MSDLSPAPWHASAPHPDHGATIITNAAGRMIAQVPNAADAAFICRARNEVSMPMSVHVDWRTFGRMVRAAREQKRFSQADAAELCGISRNYMSQIERGEANDPSYTIVLTLCIWLGLDMPQPAGGAE